MVREIKNNRLINKIDNKLSQFIKYDDIDFGTEELKNYYYDNVEIFWINIRGCMVYESIDFKRFINQHFLECEYSIVKERIKTYFKLNDYTWSN